MADEKDRFGDKLKDNEKAREDQFFAERDRTLVEKLRGGTAAEKPTETTAAMRCPKCGETLQKRVVQKITVEECPVCKGLWLDAAEFEEASKREDEGWFRRLLRGR